MVQQTAVDYLIKQISEIIGPLKTEGMTDLLLVDAIQKAKQMEKEQRKALEDKIENLEAEIWELANQSQE